MCRACVAAGCVSHVFATGRYGTLWAKLGEGPPESVAVIAARAGWVVSNDRNNAPEAAPGSEKETLVAAETEAPLSPSLLARRIKRALVRMTGESTHTRICLEREREREKNHPKVAYRRARVGAGCTRPTSRPSPRRCGRSSGRAWTRCASALRERVIGNASRDSRDASWDLSDLRRICSIDEVRVLWLCCAKHHDGSPKNRTRKRASRCRACRNWHTSRDLWSVGTQTSAYVGKTLSAIVEYVRDGANLRCCVLPDHAMITFQLAGVRCGRMNTQPKGAFRRRPTIYIWVRAT